MSYVNSILLKAQRSVRDYLAARSWTFSPTVTGGADSVTIKLPAIICDCVSAQTDPPGTGNWTAQMTVLLRENADDTVLDLHLQHAGEVADAFSESTAAASITSTVNKFGCYFLILRSMNYLLVDRSWESRIQVELRCGGTT